MSSAQPDIGQEVRAYCAELGADRLLIQGAGGNVSWKDNDVLWIKASGTWLAQANEKEIFVPVDLAQLKSAIDRDDFSIKPQVVSDSNFRPSIETTLHALLPHPIVIHLHAVEALARLVREDAEQVIRELMPAAVTWGMVDYFKPGAELAAAVKQCIGNSPDTSVIFMRNHGIVLGANSVADARSLLATVIAALKFPIENPHALLAPSSAASSYSPVSDPDLHRMALVPTLFGLVKKYWAIYPDHVVFLGPAAFCFSSWDDFGTKTITQGDLPELIFIENAGVFARDGFDKQKLAQLRCYFDVITRQEDGVPLRSLNTNQIHELLDWDAEKYRKVLQA